MNGCVLPPRTQLAQLCMDCQLLSLLLLDVQAWLKRSKFTRVKNYTWAQHGKYHDQVGGCCSSKNN